MLIPIILSGGVGARLWPVSRESHPKRLSSSQYQICCCGRCSWEAERNAVYKAAAKRNEFNCYAGQ